MLILQNKHRRHHSYHQCIPYGTKSILPTVTTWSLPESNLLRTHKENANTEVKYQNENELIEKIGDYDYWWNVPVKTSIKHIDIK